MKMLLWGKGIDFRLIMENTIWKKEWEIVGFIVSKKKENICVYKNEVYPVYSPNEVKAVQFDFILIANGNLAECLLTARSYRIDLDRIIVPYFNDSISEETVTKRSSFCMENAMEVIGILNKQHRYVKMKKLLLYGDGRYLWQLLSIIKYKNDVEIVGIVTTTHAVQGYIKIFEKDVKVFDRYEIENLDFDMLLILDENAVNIAYKLSQKIDENRIAIPFMTGIEESEYEIIRKVTPYFVSAEQIVDTLSTLHSSNWQPQHMSYDMLNYSLFNSMEYKKILGYPTYGGGVSTDYTRIRTLELLIEELQRKNVEGEIAELGVFEGQFSKILHYYFPQKELYLYDTFEGFDERDSVKEVQEGNFTEEWAQSFKQTSLEKVQKFVGKEKNIHYRKGYFPESILQEEKRKQFCLVSLDADMYNPTLAGIEFFYPRLVKGGYIMIHEYSAIRLKNGVIQTFAGVKKAVREYENQNGPISYVPISDRHGTLIITK